MKEKLTTLLSNNSWNHIAKTEKLDGEVTYELLRDGSNAIPSPGAIAEMIAAIESAGLLEFHFYPGTAQDSVQVILTPSL